MENMNAIISPIGEFIDQKLEHEYCDADIKNVNRYLRPLLLVFGLLYFLFIIPDFYLIKNAQTLDLIFLNRSVFLALTLIYAFVFKQARSYRTFTYLITACEIVFSISFLIIVYQYETPNFLIQSFGLMVIIMAFFLIPNRWIYRVIVSVWLSIAFLILSRYTLGYISLREYMAAVVYIAITLIINAISSWWINYYKRQQYLNSQKLSRLSTIDSLTQIYNRAKFDEELQKSINISQRYNAMLSLILFDIDDFKQINDCYGHPAGDNILSALSNLVKNSIRKTDIFARWGGDEFVILLPCTSAASARNVAQKLRAIVTGHSFDNLVRISCSFGVTALHNTEDYHSLMLRIDKMLYRAKQAGKNTIISE